MTPSGIESATFQIVAQCLKLRHRVALGSGAMQFGSPPRLLGLLDSDDEDATALRTAGNYQPVVTTVHRSILQ